MSLSCKHTQTHLSDRISCRDEWFGRTFIDSLGRCDDNKRAGDENYNEQKKNETVKNYADDIASKNKRI